MLPVSTDFLHAVRSSHERLVTVAIQTPGASGILSDPITFDVAGGSTRAAFTNGQRYEASINVAPDDSRKWSELLLTPGSLFTVDVSVRTSGNAFESCRLFTGELSSAPTVSFYGDGFDLTMQDQWLRLERCRYLSPFKTPAAKRSAIITTAVTGAIPYVSVLVSPAASATHAGGVLVDKMRTDLIIDLANDSEPDYSVGFNAEGNFVVNTAPVIDIEDAVWDIVDGENGTLLDFQYIKQVDRLYNTVVVKPAAANQTWTQVVVEITDVDHPRHKSKIGVVPYFQVAPTASGSSVALNIGKLTLERILKEQASGRVIAVDNPALEPGDVITVTTTTGPNTGVIIPALVTSISRDLVAGTMELEIQRNFDTEIGESEET